MVSLKKTALIITAVLCMDHTVTFGAKFNPRPQTNPVPANIPLDSTLDFSYTPDEPGIPDFPKPIDAHETDLQVLANYYESISQAYETWGKKKIEEARVLQAKTLHENQGLAHQRLRAGSGIGAKPKLSQNEPLQKSHIQAVSYYQSSYVDSQQQADLYLKKALIYQDLADMCTDVMNNITKENVIF